MNKLELKQRQSLPLQAKINHTKMVIREWYDYYEGDVYVAFSGGKDSTVLLHLVRSIYPDVKAVYVNTGLEYPEIVNFIRVTENVVWLKPTMNFREVLEHHGYPIISKVQATSIRKLTTQNLSERYRNKLLHGDERGSAGKLSDKWHYLLDAPFKVSEKCCDVMKKNPVKKFEKDTKLHGITGEMASDSSLRETNYLRYGCNVFDANYPKSRPLSIWTDEDIWEYIKMYNIPYSKIYDTGVKRTGCVFCMFGVHLEKEPNRFQILKQTHPKLYNYCIDKLGLGQVLDYIGVDY